MTDRIYIACLASYNAGRLHGKWIDATADVDAMQAEVRAMLRASPCPNVIRVDYRCQNEACREEHTTDLPYGQAAAGLIECPTCGADMSPIEQYRSAEEWAIHDYDGDYPDKFGEYTSLDTIAAWIELLDEAEDRGIPASVVKELASHYGEPDSKGEPFPCTREAMEENFAGVHASLGAWQEELSEECGELNEIPDSLRQYINWDAKGRDLELGGEIFTVNHGPDQTYIFWSR